MHKSCFGNTLFQQCAYAHLYVYITERTRVMDRIMNHSSFETIIITDKTIYCVLNYVSWKEKLCAFPEFENIAQVLLARNTHAQFLYV